MTNPQFLGAWDFEPGEEKAVVIDHVEQRELVNQDGRTETRPVVVFSSDSVKPLVLNVSNARTIEKLYSSPDVDTWHGKAVILRAQKVRAFGEVVEAVRVKRETPILCETCGAVIRPFKGYTVAELVQRSRNKYGKTLCTSCAAREGGKKPPEGSE